MLYKKECKEPHALRKPIESLQKLYDFSILQIFSSQMCSKKRIFTQNLYEFQEMNNNKKKSHLQLGNKKRHTQKKTYQFNLFKNCIYLVSARKTNY